MKYKHYNIHNYISIPQIKKISPKQRHDLEVIAKVLPFKTNNYVVEQLIDWDNIEFDPLYRMNFFQRGMLTDKHFNMLESEINVGGSKKSLDRLIKDIRYQLNPDPSGQMMYNVPEFKGEKLMGIQHKYKETILFFPTQGQSCHAYCTFCFRWPQFSNMKSQKFFMKETGLLTGYLKEHPEVTDLLFTGGDPMIMSSRHFETYVNAVLEADLPNLKNIRIGTKALSYWPYRFVSDPDSDHLLSLFRKIVDSGKHLAVMANFNHPRELYTDIFKVAVKNIQNTGAIIRGQSPILNNINADADVWADLWKKQVEKGIIPYYMFMPRDTGAQHYFAVPLIEAWKIYTRAYSKVSGIARTVRGPVMSANPGKIKVLGVSDFFDEKVITLNFIQARNTNWINKPFFARYDESALWLNDLKPAFGKREFFFERSFRSLQTEKKHRVGTLDNYSSLCS